MPMQESFKFEPLGFATVTSVSEYAVDAWQRSLLYADVMRERGNQYLAHLAEETPNVLSFGFERVMSGRDLKRPVNYGLVRIIPPEGVEIEIAAELAVDAAQQVQVEVGGDALRIVIGGFEHRPVLPQVRADQERA